MKLNRPLKFWDLSNQNSGIFVSSSQFTECNGLLFIKIRLEGMILCTFKVSNISAYLYCLQRQDLGHAPAELWLNFAGW